jgi:tetratricopeptide (TPR) repeat protein
LGISLFFIFRPSKNERLYSEYFKVYDSGYTVRGIDMSVKDKFHIAMDAYDNNDFVNSSILLKEVCKSEPNNIEALFFKGISEMKNKNFDDAILSLNTIAKDSTTLFREPVIWYVALCYLEKKDLLNTKITLQKIINAPDNSYKKQAAFLLKDLE